MKPTPALRFILLGTFVFSVSPLLQATPYYWDTDDTTGGFGNTAGTWGTSTFWSADSTGASSTANTTITSTDGVNFGTSSLALTSPATTIGIVAGGVTTNSITFGSAQATAVTLSSGGGTITLAGTTPTITVDNTSDTIGASLKGTDGMTKAGTGTLILTGTSNTYTGNTTISGGTLDVSGGRIYNSVTGPQVVTVNNSGVLVVLNMAAGGVGSLSANAANLVVNGGTIRQTAATESSRGRAITVGANGATLEVDGSGYVMGYVLATPNVYTDNSTFTLSGSGSATITKKISGTGVSLVKDGSGTWIISPDVAVATNTYTGATQIKAGTLRVGLSASGQALGNGSAVTLSNVSGATLNINGFSQTIGSLAGGGITGGNVTLGANATLTTGGNNTSTTYAGIISGTGTSGLTKTGAGTLTLSAANDYTGATAVLAGTLVVGDGVSGSLANTAVTVGGNGSAGTPKLSGRGTIGGATILSSAGSGVVGIHAPGVAGADGGVGTQTFTKSLTYQAGSIFEWDLKTGASGTAGTDFDSVALTSASGIFSVDGTSTTGSIFKIVLGEAFDGGNAFWSDPAQKAWNVFAATSGASLGSGVFNNFQLFDTSSPTVPVNFSSYGSFGFTNNGSAGTLTWNAVPEPTTALAGLLLGAGLFRRRRA